jgi:hypothetical protein
VKPWILCTLTCWSMFFLYKPNAAHIMYVESLFDIIAELVIVT